jgi:NAD(P)-dependent dehydrogenase (short-subunit alcohol dehydrogenase family)
VAGNDQIDFARLAPVAGSRIAIVGGCGGIGRELASACHALRLRTAVLDLPGVLARHPPHAEDTVRVSVDVTSEQAVVKGFGELDLHWGGLDVLVFLAGIAVLPPRSIEELTSSQWDEVLQVNLRAAWFCVREALPLMKKVGGGSIVTISSSLAYNPNRGFSAYVASKGGLISFTKAIATENGPTIRANVVAPSAVDTAFLAGGTGREADGGSDDWFRKGLQGYLANIPLGRLAKPDDIVGPILFLAGPAARYITGQVIHVNGGRITP